MTGTLTEDVLTLLRKPLFAHVATVMPDGTPQNTPILIDTDGMDVLFNTAKGLVKHRNLLQNPSVAISLIDDQNPYRMIEIRGVAEMTEEGADQHIDALAKKYLGQDTYPFRQPGEQRIVVRVRPTAIAGT